MKRTYQIEMAEVEGGGIETVQITVEGKTVEETDAAAHAAAERAVTEWVRSGDWGADGASVRVWSATDDLISPPRAASTLLTDQTLCHIL
jgi:hypothetical protein